MNRWNWKKYRVVERPEIYYNRKTDTDDTKAVVRSCAAAKVRCGQMTTSHGES